MHGADWRRQRADRWREYLRDRLLRQQLSTALRGNWAWPDHDGVRRPARDQRNRHLLLAEWNDYRDHDNQRDSPNRHEYDECLRVGAVHAGHRRANAGAIGRCWRADSVLRLLRGWNRAGFPGARYGHRRRDAADA